MEQLKQLRGSWNWGQISVEATHLTRRCVWSTSTEVYISKHLNSLKDLGLSADVTVENGSYVTYALLKKIKC